MGTIRSRSSAALVALALLASGLVLVAGAAPAQAAWTNASGLTRFHLCKEATPSGRGWFYLARASKRGHTEDARAGMRVYVKGKPRQGWGSGWLRDREVDRGWVRAQRQRGVRIHVWQEAGDRDSMVGTALERAVLRPRGVKRC